MLQKYKKDNRINESVTIHIPTLFKHLGISQTGGHANDVMKKILRFDKSNRNNGHK